MQPQDFLAIAAGNTTIRWRAYRAGIAGPIGAVPVRAPAPPELRAEASRLFLVAASVNPPRLARLAEELARPVAAVGIDIPIPIRNATRRPDEVGVDRLLAALGAYRRHGPSVVIDAGTAITVNLVEAGPTFQGGAILPGPGLWARALAEGTALLPAVVPSAAAPPACGKDTDEAIAAGLYWGIAGAVRELVDRIRGGRTELEICLTGGGAALLRPHIGSAVHAEDDLLFEGIRIAVTEK